MYAGEIVEIGAAFGGAGDARHPYTKALLASVRVSTVLRSTRS